MVKYDEVLVERLQLHELNPRFRQPMAQDEAIAYFAKDPKTRRLAKDISLKGLNPLDLIGAMKIDGSRKLLVREGNRRAAALKLLLDPAKAATSADEAYFSKLARANNAIVPKKAFVAILEDEAAMRYWIRLKHVPESNGVSTVFWDPWQKSNFDDGSGPPAKYKNARELVNAAIGHGWLDQAATDSIKLSTISRILDDEKARAVIGFSVDPNGLHTSLGVDEQRKVAMRIIADTGKGGSETSRTLQTTANLERYAKGLVRDLKLKVDPKAVGTRIGGNPPAAPNPGGRAPRAKQIPTDVNRKHVVPKGFRAEITNARAAEVVKELQTLDVYKTWNSPAVLLRMLIEFSVFHYAEANGIPRTKTDRGVERRKELHPMIVDVVSHLRTNKRVELKDIALINKSLTQPDHFLSAAQLNQFVHNPDMHVKPREINSDWNGVANFIRALWA